MATYSKIHTESQELNRVQNNLESAFNESVLERNELLKAVEKKAAVDLENNVRSINKVIDILKNRIAELEDAKQTNA